MKERSDFEKWFNEVHPKYCKCGKEIVEHKFGINGVDVCEECFYEATKNSRFK